MSEEETAKCNCPVQLRTMEAWVSEDDPKNCRPCMLAPVTQWYHSELKEQGYGDQAKKIEQVIEEGADPLTMCQTFDIIKGEVGESTRERLLEFDCTAQAYEPEPEPEPSLTSQQQQSS